MLDLLAPSVLETCLRDAVAEVLEKMFFIRILEDPGSISEHAEEQRNHPGIAVRVSFHGEPSGWLWLRLNGGAARSIAGDFLGEEEPGLEQRQVAEVVCELANMICGAVLSRVESTVTFRLDSPEIVDMPDASADPQGTAQHAFPIGDGDLTTKIWMEAPA